jgi:ABC-type molybdate transport system permease subunit
MSTLISLMLGVVAARLLARRRSAVASLLDVLCTLPMVLPPTVLGYYLILVFGRGGLLGPGLLGRSRVGLLNCAPRQQPAQAPRAQRNRNESAPHDASSLL